jgi:hypothetical protein
MWRTGGFRRRLVRVAGRRAEQAGASFDASVGLADDLDRRFYRWRKQRRRAVGKVA